MAPLWSRIWLLPPSHLPVTADRAVIEKPTPVSLINFQLVQKWPEISEALRYFKLA